MLLIDLDDYTLIYILSLLHPSQLFSIRKTCRRLHTMTSLHIVWTNACKYHILGRGYPFPNTPLESFSTHQLERHVQYATGMVKRWYSPSDIFDPRGRWVHRIRLGEFVCEAHVRFLPGTQGQILFTISKNGLVDITRLFSVTSKDGNSVGGTQWSPKGVFNSFTVNSSPSHEVALVISSVENEKHVIDFLKLDADSLILNIVKSITSNLRPVLLQGDLFAVTDDYGETVIANWRTGAYATLRHRDDKCRNGERCIQVAFAYQSIVIITPDTLYLFPFPVFKAPDHGPLEYTPIARHHFSRQVLASSTNFITRNHVHLAPSEDEIRSQPLSVLLRTVDDNIYNVMIELYTFKADLSYHDVSSDFISRTPTMPSAPYIFPPTLEYKVHTGVKGQNFPCPDVRLGRVGTAVWIKSHDEIPLCSMHPRSTPLPDNRVWDIPYSAILPGPFDPGPGNVCGSKQCLSRKQCWTSLDYDEDVGCIVLDSKKGPLYVVDF